MLHRVCPVNGATRGRRERSHSGPEGHKGTPITGHRRPLSCARFTPPASFAPFWARIGPVNGFEAVPRPKFCYRGRTGGAAPLPEPGPAPGSSSRCARSSRCAPAEDYRLTAVRCLPGLHILALCKSKNAPASPARCATPTPTGLAVPIARRVKCAGLLFSSSSDLFGARQGPERPVWLRIATVAVWAAQACAATRCGLAGLRQCVASAPCRPRTTNGCELLNRQRLSLHSKWSSTTSANVTSKATPPTPSTNATRMMRASVSCTEPRACDAPPGLPSNIRLARVMQPRRAARCSCCTLSMPTARLPGTGGCGQGARRSLQTAGSALLRRRRVRWAAVRCALEAGQIRAEAVRSGTQLVPRGPAAGRLADREGHVRAADEATGRLRRPGPLRQISQ